MSGSAPKQPAPMPTPQAECVQPPPYAVASSRASTSTVPLVLNYDRARLFALLNAALNEPQADALSVGNNRAALGMGATVATALGTAAAVAAVPLLGVAAIGGAAFFIGTYIRGMQLDQQRNSALDEIVLAYILPNLVSPQDLNNPDIVRQVIRNWTPQIKDAALEKIRL